MDKESFINLIKSYFTEFLTENNLYDNIIEYLENKYTSHESLDWEDISFLQDNSLINSYLLTKLYSNFTFLFDKPEKFVEISLILFHRFPFAKVKFYCNLYNNIIRRVIFHIFTHL